MLVSAADADAARRRASELGSAANQTYKNAEGEDVAWQCIEVLDIHGIPDASVEEGSELYSFFVASDLLNEIRKRMYEEPDIANPSY